MARWKLTAPHYLMTDPPTEWEQKETNRETGRQHRVVHKVPRLLHPDDPSDCNYQDEIIVSDGHNPQSRDIIFLGEPTPDMEPIDDEAKAITKKFIDSGKWRRKEDGEVFGEALIKEFMTQIARAQSQPVSMGGIDTKAFSELQQQVNALVEQNAKLMEQLTAKEEPAPEKRVGRRL